MTKSQDSKIESHREHGKSMAKKLEAERGGGLESASSASPSLELAGIPKADSIGRESELKRDRIQYRRIFLLRRSIWAAAVLAIGASAFAASFLPPTIRATLWDPSRDDDNDFCTSGAPIAVTVTNWSLRRLARVYFDMELWLDNRSRNVLVDTDARLFDAAVAPFSSETLCFTDTLFEQMFASPETSSTSADASAPKNLMAEAIPLLNKQLAEYSQIATRATVSVHLYQPEYR